MSTSEAAATSGANVHGLTAFKPRVMHVAYHVADIERALRFYQGVLGLKELLRMPLGEGLHEVILGFPNSQSAGVILMWNAEKTAGREHGDGYSRLVLNVSDVEAAVQHLVQHQTPVTTPVTTFGTLKFAMVKDPDGYVIELLQILKG